MRVVLGLMVIALLSIAGVTKAQGTVKNQAELTNQKAQTHAFLSCMYADSYYPKAQVDKCKKVLVELCFEIEKSKPETLDQLYVLTHEATNKINGLQVDFEKNQSEIETAARECLAESFEYISIIYGYKASVEKMIAPRHW